MSDISYLSDIDDLHSAIQFDISNGSPIDLQKFKIVHYNIESITANGRIEALSDVCKCLNISVLILTETHLDETIPNNIITLSGYHDPIRHDRTNNGRYGGGCMIYISESLTFNQQHNKQTQQYEHLWVDVMSEGKKIAINCLYRPPIETQESHQNFLETSESILESLSNYQADVKVIMSDLNFGNCYCVSPTLKFKPLDHKAPELFSSFGFQQLIDIPTRNRTTLSLIDLIFVNSVDLVQEYGTLPEIADHEGILLCLDIKQKPQYSTKKLLYDYKSADLEGMKKYINEYDFDSKVFSLPVNSQAEFYTKVLIDCFEKFVPKREAFFKPQSIPWCNTYTRLLLRKKNRNYKFLKQVSQKYLAAHQNINCEPQILTKLLDKKETAKN